MRFEVWQWSTGRRIAAFATEAAALTWLRRSCDGTDTSGFEDLGLVDNGTPGSPATYPLEGAALLAKAFGLGGE